MSGSEAGHHSDAEYVEAVREHEPAATSEIAAAVGVERQSADYRLRTLEDEGSLTSKKIGNSLAWFLTEDDEEVNSIDPSDEFWTAEAHEGEARRASDIDEVIYRVRFARPG